MSIASVAEEKYPKIEEDTLPQVDESDKIINEMRKKQIARLNAALQAIKEIKEEKYNENECVVGEGFVLENQKTSHARSIGNKQRTAGSSSLAARRQRIAGNSSLAARRQRTAGSSSLAARRQREFTPFAQPPQPKVKEKVPIIILYER